MLRTNDWGRAHGPGHALVALPHDAGWRPSGGRRLAAGGLQWPAASGVHADAVSAKLAPGLLAVPYPLLANPILAIKAIIIILAYKNGPLPVREPDASRGGCQPRRAACRAATAVAGACAGPTSACGAASQSTSSTSSTSPAGWRRATPSCPRTSAAPAPPSGAGAAPGKSTSGRTLRRCGQCLIPRRGAAAHTSRPRGVRSRGGGPRERRGGPHCRSPLPGQVLDWIGKQGFCDGRVGLFGQSYDAVAALWTVSLKHPLARAPLPTAANPANPSQPIPTQAPAPAACAARQQPPCPSATIARSRSSARWR